MLKGGADRDILTGGSGNDIFDFTSRSDSTGRRIDVITDFDDRGNDRIDLSDLQGRALRFIDEHRFTKVGQVRINDVAGSDVIIEVNLSGRRVPEFSIRLDNTSADSITAGDFVL